MRVRITFDEPYELDLEGARALYGVVDEAASTDARMVVRVDEDRRINGKTIERIEVSARHVGSSLRDVEERGFVIVNGAAFPTDGSEGIRFIGWVRIAGGGPRAPIFAAVTTLEGLPMWGSGRAVDMEMFAFGKRVPRRGRDGREYEAGEYALHLQCSWRLWKDGRTLVGSADEFDGMSSDEGRRDRLLREVFKGEPLIVRAVHTGSSGHLLVRFENGCELEVLPDWTTDQDNEPAENWRFLRVGSAPHLVYYSDGFRLE